MNELIRIRLRKLFKQEANQQTGILEYVEKLKENYGESLLLEQYKMYVEMMIEMTER